MSPRAAHGRRGHRAPRPPRVTAAVAGIGALAVAAACMAGAELTGAAGDKADQVALGDGTPGVIPTPTSGPSSAPASSAPYTLTTASPAASAPVSPSATEAAKPSAPRTADKPASAPTRTAAKKPSATKADSGSRPTGSSEAQEVVRLANIERAAAGCKPLTVDADLTRAAQDYTDDMAATGNFSHTGTDGSQPQDRIEAAGYTWSRSGENIAKGQSDAAAVMDAWMNSPGHRANILNCGFTEIGVGVSTDGGPWWTQDFGTPA
ncbi:CAP domain-containing protein [Streptomyces sp. NPDC051921]|uniref:CAP domain-containing protein n=1 Tax=Streptomyces sp. NPDC051921 TaxID=3155806 RepID=UPI0034163332